MILWIIIIVVVIMIVALMLVWYSTSITDADKSTWYLVIIGVSFLIIIMLALWWYYSMPPAVQSVVMPPIHTEVWHHNDTPVMPEPTPVTHHVVTHDHFHHTAQQDAYIESPPIVEVPAPAVTVTRSAPPMRSTPPQGYRQTTVTPLGTATIDPDPTVSTSVAPGMRQRILVRNERGEVHYATYEQPSSLVRQVEDRPRVPVTRLPPGYAPPPGAQSYQQVGGPPLRR